MYKKNMKSLLFCLILSDFVWTWYTNKLARKRQDFYTRQFFRISLNNNKAVKLFICFSSTFCGWYSVWLSDSIKQSVETNCLTIIPQCSSWLLIGYHIWFSRLNKNESFEIFESKWFEILVMNFKINLVTNGLMIIIIYIHIDFWQV